MVPLFEHGRKSLHFTLINFEDTLKMSLAHRMYTEEIKTSKYMLSIYPTFLVEKENFNFFPNLAHYFKYMLAQR
jgi:hypothetical protein